MKIFFTTLALFICNFTFAQVENTEKVLAEKANYYFHFYFGLDKNLLSDDDRELIEKSGEIDPKYWASKGINLFSELIEQYPNSINQAEYLYKKGVLNMGILNYKDSKNCFRKGAELKDTEYKKLALLNLAKIACMEKNYDETSRYLRLMEKVKAVIAEPTSEFINQNLEQIKNSGCSHF